METEGRHEIDSKYAGVILAMTVCATISGISVTSLLLYMFSKLIAPCWARIKQDPHEERLFLRNVLGAFVMCLLVSDLALAIGGMIEGHWAVARAVQTGPVCTMQGILIEIGNVGTAVWSLAVAILTFLSLVLGKVTTRGYAVATFAFGWLIVVLFVILGPLTAKRGEFYGPSQQWCHISDGYKTERLLLNYFPMWSSGFLILVLYSMVFLKLRGYLQVEGWQWSFHRKPTGLYANATPGLSVVNYTRSVANKVLWYPVVYIILILPVSVCRMMSISNNIGWPIAVAIHYLMGIANTLLYTFTRRIGPSQSTPAPNTLQVFVDRSTHDVAEASYPRSPRERKLPIVPSSSSSSPRSPTRKDFSIGWFNNYTHHQSKPSSSLPSEPETLEINPETLNNTKTDSQSWLDLTTGA